VPRSGTFQNFFGFSFSAKRYKCNYKGIELDTSQPKGMRIIGLKECL